MDEFSQAVLDIFLLLKEADCLKYSVKFCKSRVIHGFLSFKGVSSSPSWVLAGRGMLLFGFQVAQLKLLACNNSIIVPDLSFPPQALYVGLSYTSSDCTSWFFRSSGFSCCTAFLCFSKFFAFSVISSHESMKCR